MNYFTIAEAYDLGEGFVLLSLDHDYGKGPRVRIPVSGDIADYEKGKRVEVTVEVV